jgi:hypothetical protein
MQTKHQSLLRYKKIYYTHLAARGNTESKD